MVRPGLTPEYAYEHTLVSYFKKAAFFYVLFPLSPSQCLQFCNQRHFYFFPYTVLSQGSLALLDA